MEIKTSMQKLVDPYTQQVQKQSVQKPEAQSQAGQAQSTGDRVSVSHEARMLTDRKSVV